MPGINKTDMPQIQTSPEIRKHAFRLMEENNQLKGMIETHSSTLDQNGVGMHEPLVDAEGYPHSDIDVYRVRHARHQIICLNNDLARNYNWIHDHLHIAMAKNDEHATPNKSDPDGDVCNAFVRIGMVTENSPAYDAGLKVDDLITRFGSIDKNNFRNLNDLATVVHHSINHFIKISVIQCNVLKKIYLKPHPWSGDGLVGCSLLPLN